MSKRFFIGLILSIISGILISLSYVYPAFGFLMWFALVPLMVGCFGFSANLWQFGAFCAIASTTYLVLVESYAYARIESIWIKMIPPLAGILIGLTAILFRKILTWRDYRLFIPLTALLFVSIDLLISFTVAGNVISPATTQSTYPLIIQVASILGIHSVTFILAVSNALIALVILNHRAIREHYCQIAVGLALILLAVIYGALRLNYSAGITVPVAAIQGDRRNDFYDLIGEAAHSGARLIVLPETSFAYRDDASFRPWKMVWKAIASTKNIYLVMPYFSSYENQNMAALVSPDGEIGAPYVKHHIAKVVGEDCKGGTEYPVYRTEFGIIGIMICYDGYFPDVGRKLAAQGARLIAMPSNTMTPAISRIAPRAVIPFRAVENGVGIAVADMVYGSMIIDPFGRILKQAPMKSGVIISGNLPLLNRNTFYTRYGYLFPYICLICLVLILGLMAIRKKK